MSTTRRPYKAQWAVVTGASSGIGQKLAEELARGGASLLIVARRRDRLEKLVQPLRDLGAPEVQFFEADLSQSQGVHGLIGQLEKNPQGWDILVNNAGLGVSGAYAEADWARLETLLAVNVRALSELSHWAARHMKARGRGGILNVASSAAFQPIPGFAFYAASKSFVSSLSAALHRELRPFGVHVSCLHPGKTETEFFEAAGMLGQDLAFFRMPGMKAQDVARIGLSGLARNRPRVVAGGMNRFVALLARWLPLGVSLRVGELLFRNSAP